jgi:hypothetical protein
MSRLLNKIGFVKGSNRAYVTGLNDLRTRVWSNTITDWTTNGGKLVSDGELRNLITTKGTEAVQKMNQAGEIITSQDLKDLAQLINWSTGRGTMPKALANQGSLLNAIFFSPRLIFSRLELPTAVLPWVTKSSLVRKQAWKTLMTSMGVGVSVITALKMSGMGDIELDPRSSDFGKIKIGDTRLDIWTGYAQYIRFAAQLATSERMTSGGYTQKVSRKDTLERMLQSKLSPAMGLLNDIVTGETYLGEDMPPKSMTSVAGQVWQRLAPLSIQDLIDGINQDGVTGGVATSVGFLGVGVTTYTDDVKKARDNAAKANYNGMTWDEVGLKYGKAAQIKLEQIDNELLKAEQEQEKRFATSSPTTMKQWQTAGKSIEDTYRTSVEQASAEFRDTQDGVAFKDKITDANTVRRQMYAARANQKEYSSITDYYNRALTQAEINKMNPGDVARREYYRMMYGADMYDKYGNYLFDLAEKRETEFLTKYGQQALDYIEEYQGSRWVDKPAELKYLEQAKDTLKPYWQIVDYVWAMYPPELKSLSEQISILERTNPEQARKALKKFPSILRARELIAKAKKTLREKSPAINQAYSVFYG